MDYYTVGGHYNTGEKEGFSLLLDGEHQKPFVSTSAEDLFRVHRKFSHVYRLSSDLTGAIRVYVSEQAEMLGIKAPTRVQVRAKFRRLIAEQIEIMESIT